MCLRQIHSSRAESATRCLAPPREDSRTYIMPPNLRYAEMEALQPCASAAFACPAPWRPIPGAVRAPNAPATCMLSRGQTGAALAVSAAAAALVTLAGPASAGVISAGECFNGTGPGCAAKEEESALIRELIEKSRANKDKNERATLEKYWEAGYNSYFSFDGQELSKQADGSYKLGRQKSIVGNVLRSFGWEPPSEPRSRARPSS